MPLTVDLHFSNSSRLLLDRMMEQLTGERESLNEALTGPLHLLLPSSQMQQLVRIELAKKYGSVVGLSMGRMEYYLWNALDPAPRDRLINREVMQQFVSAGLQRVLEEKEPQFEPLYRYLLGDEWRKGELSVSPNRRAGLVSQLSSLFLEYELNRPGVYDAAGKVLKGGFEQAWGGGEQLYFFEKAVDKSPQVREMELWQRALYRTIFGDHPGYLKLKEGELEWEWWSLPALARKRRSEGVLGRSVEGKRVLLYSPMGLSHFHRNLLLELPHRLSVYQLNPSAAFWEDLDTRRVPHFEREKRSEEFERSTLQADPESEVAAYRQGLYPDDDNKLLQLWGELSKESVTLWCQASQYDFEYIAAEEGDENVASPTLLNELKRRLLYRIPDSAKSAECGFDLSPEARENDRSLVMAEALTKLREVEWVRGEILRLLQENPGWKLSDFLVISPELELYRTAIHQVFTDPQLSLPTGESVELRRPLPVAIEGDLFRLSHYISAVRHLFALLKSNFGRREVVYFLRNRFVQEAIGLQSDQLKAWEQWIAEINIFEGFDGDELKRSGARAESNPLHTWWWGFNRLLLSDLTDIPLLQNDLPSLYPFRNIDTTDSSLLTLFIGTVEELYRDLRNLQLRFAQKEMAIEERVDQLLLLISKWIAIPFGEDDEARISSHLISLIKQFRWQEKLGRRSISLLEMLAQIELQLGKVEELHKFSSPLGALRFVLPHAGQISSCKAIFWMGLSASSFPGRPSDSHFNLLNVKRIIGDQKRVAQQRFAFLESILAAENFFALSWLSENIKKQTELNPSSVTLELERYLNSTILASGSEKRGEWRWNRESISLRKALEEAKGQNAKPLGPVAHAEIEKSHQIVGTRELFLWLYSPVKYRLTRQMRLRDVWDEDLTEERREPYEYDHLETSRYCERVMHRLIPELLRNIVKVPKIEREQLAPHHLKAIEIKKELNDKALMNRYSEEVGQSEMRQLLQLLKQFNEEWEGEGRMVALSMRPYVSLPPLFTPYTKALSAVHVVKKIFAEHFDVTDRNWEGLKELRFDLPLTHGELLSCRYPYYIENDHGLFLIKISREESKEANLRLFVEELLVGLALRARGESRPIYTVGFFKNSLFDQVFQVGLYSDKGALQLLSRIALHLNAPTPPPIPLNLSWSIVLKNFRVGRKKMIKVYLEFLKAFIDNDIEVKNPDGNPKAYPSEIERSAGIHSLGLSYMGWVEYHRMILAPLISSGAPCLFEKEFQKNETTKKRAKALPKEGISLEELPKAIAEGGHDDK